MKIFIAAMQEVFPKKRLIVTLRLGLVVVLVLGAAGASFQGCNPTNPPPKNPEPVPYKVPAPRVNPQSQKS